jgi:hypothetical protein
VTLRVAQVATLPAGDQRGAAPGLKVSFLRPAAPRRAGPGRITGTRTVSIIRPSLAWRCSALPSEVAQAGAESLPFGRMALHRGQLDLLVAPDGQRQPGQLDGGGKSGR